MKIPQLTRVSTIKKTAKKSSSQKAEHHQAMLNAFLEKALAGDEEANKLSRDYAAGKMTKVDLWEEMRRRYGSKDSDELIA